MKLNNIRKYFEKDKVVDAHTYYKSGDINLKIISSLKENKKTLSLGCGGGREVKKLVEKGHKVIAIDFAKNMIAMSQHIEPNAEYICIDANIFAEQNKNKKEFDYILGLFNFICEIKNKDRQKLIDNLMSMLKGEAIFTFNYVGERWQEVIKILASPFIAMLYQDLKNYKFGDIYPSYKNLRWCSHHFTKKQIKKLFKNYDYEIKNNIVYVKNKSLFKI